MDEGEENECFKSFFHWHDKVAVEQPEVKVQDPVQVEDKVIESPEVQEDNIQKEEQIQQPPPPLKEEKPKETSQAPPAHQNQANLEASLSTNQVE